MRRISLLLATFALVACGSDRPISQAVIDQALAYGAAPDLMYVVDLPGYELNEQSVGGINEEGFGAFYVSPDGKRVQLRVDRGTFDDELCAARPITDAEPADAPVQCTKDEVGWYRQGAGRHEYIALKGDALILLTGQTADVAKDALKTAVSGARLAVPSESAASSPPPTPVERGDLPTTGDGAPNNEVGPGG